MTESPNIWFIYHQLLIWPLRLILTFLPRDFHSSWIFSAQLRSLSSAIPSRNFGLETKINSCQPNTIREMTVLSNERSHFSCQSGGVHDSNSIPGFSKYVVRNSCSLPDGTVVFGNPCERLRKADKTTSAGKDKKQKKGATYWKSWKKADLLTFDLPGVSLSFMSTKYLSSSNTLAVCTWCKTGPEQ